jgi:hypothetical protein
MLVRKSLRISGKQGISFIVATVVMLITAVVNAAITQKTFEGQPPDRAGVCVQTVIPFVQTSIKLSRH